MLYLELGGFTYLQTCLAFRHPEHTHTTHDTGMDTQVTKTDKKMNTPASSEGAITRAAGSEEEELLPHRSSEPTSIAISSSNPCASMVAALPVMLLEEVLTYATTSQ